MALLIVTVGRAKGLEWIPIGASFAFVEDEELAALFVWRFGRGLS